jgi:hypothetical protein
MLGLGVQAPFESQPSSLSQYSAGVKQSSLSRQMSMHLPSCFTLTPLIAAMHALS